MSGQQIDARETNRDPEREPPVHEKASEEAPKTTLGSMEEGQKEGEDKGEQAGSKGDAAAMQRDSYLPINKLKDAPPAKEGDKIPEDVGQESTGVMHTIKDAGVQLKDAVVDKAKDPLGKKNKEASS